MKQCLVCGQIENDDAIFCSRCRNMIAYQIPVTPRRVAVKSGKGVGATLGKIALYVAVFFAVQIVVSIVLGIVLGVSAVLNSNGAPADELSDILTEVLLSLTSVISLVSNLVFALGISLFFIIRKKNVFKEVRVRKFPLALIPACAAVGFFTNPVLSVLTSFLPIPEILVENYESGTTDLVSGNLILAIISISVVTGIVEEFLFRGIILRRFMRICSPAKAVIFSSILFAGVHFSIVSFPAIFVLALFLGAIFVKYDSVIPCMITHIFFNLFAILGFPSEEPLLILSLLFIAAAISVGIPYLVLKNKTVKE